MTPGPGVYPPGQVTMYRTFGREAAQSGAARPASSRPERSGRNGRSWRMVLGSYVNGSWTSPSAEGAPLLDAVTGEQVTTISTAGIDMRAALEYGRTVGGPALRELTFHQRAAILKSLAQFLRERRAELYALSARTGATLFDSK